MGEAAARYEAAHQKPTEQRLKAVAEAAYEEKLKAAQERVARAEAEAAQARKDADLAESRVAVRQALAEAKLPAPAVARVEKKLHDEVQTAESIAEAITLERDYLKSLGVTAKPAAVAGAGPAKTSPGAQEMGEIDAARADKTIAVVESVLGFATAAPAEKKDGK
ncbi:MAG: hypothetical protein L0221_09890 [Chloroflexi bacterium]|nr:hypothetical protein [Chloroflexota bacterium]